MKKTAVEWLIDQIILKTETTNDYILMSDKNIENIVEKAKKMEKKQMELSDKVIYEMADGLFQDNIYKHGFKHGMVLYRQLLKEKK